MSTLSHPVISTLEALPDQAFSECEAMVDGELESLVLFRDGGQVRVWMNICPHAGRRLDWAPGQFLTSKEGHLVCAAHGATFESVNGNCVGGPCRGSTLRALPVQVIGGEVVLCE